MSEHVEFTAIHEEHRELLRSLEEIESLIQPGPGGSGQAAARLRGEVDRLPGALERHFEREEEGVFRMMEAEHPEWSGALDALRREHGEILAALESIREGARSLRDPGLVAGIRDGLGAVLAKLRNHEHRETELIQESVSRDLGSSSLA